MHVPLTIAPPAPAQAYGAVFTQRWVVDLILDLCGYVASEDLSLRVAVEPACGDGAFLVPIAQRLSASLRLHGRRLSDAKSAIRGFDLQEQHVERCRRSTVGQLLADGWDPTDVATVVAAWIRQGDYLLTVHAQDADLVVGNPPYIRSDDMPPSARRAYMDMCSTMTPGSDIFVGFIQTGLRSLKREGGVLSFIGADRWMHNSYGRRLRGLVADCYAVEAVCEMHGVNAFAEDVSAYPAITQIRRARQGEAVYAAASERFDAAAAERLMSWVRGGTERSDDPDFRAARLPGWFHTEGMWPSAGPERIALVETLNDEFMPLEDQATGTRVGIGIATGADDVFVTGDELLVEPERMLPLVTTAHIESGHLDGRDKWLVNPWDDAGRLVELGDYPRLESYLSTKAERLARRHVVQKAPTDWYRTIDKVYPGLRGAPKLLLADMKATIQPVLDPGLGYPHHNLYCITSTGWDLEVLGGILLSRVAQMFVEAYGVKMRGGTLRFQAQYLRLIRVPAPGSVPPALVARLKRAFQRRDVDEATAAALEAHSLTHLPDQEPEEGTGGGFQGCRDELLAPAPTHARRDRPAANARRARQRQRTVSALRHTLPRGDTVATSVQRRPSGLMKLTPGTPSGCA